MTPVQYLRHYKRVLLWMKVKRLARENAIFVLYLLSTVGLCLQAYSAGKQVGIERTLRVLEPHICAPAPQDDTADYRT